MCVDKEKWEKFQKEMKEDVRELMHDMKGIRTSQQALGELSKKTEKHLRELNSRTSKIEARTDNLEDPEFRIVRCIQREPVDYIMHNMLTVDKFEEWEQKKQEEKEKQEEKLQQELENRLKKDSIAVHKLDARQRRNGWITTAIIGAGTIAMALIGYLS